MKRILYHSTAARTALVFFSVGFLFAVASASNPPDLSITATPSSGLSNAFYLGQTFTLMLTGAPVNATFTICAFFPGGTRSCTPNWGKTNASGTWTQSGIWIASTTPTGAYEESIQFPAQNISSNGINFTMAASGPGTGPVTPPITSPVSPVTPTTPTSTPQTPGAILTSVQGYNPTTDIYTSSTAIQNTYSPRKTKP